MAKVPPAPTTAISTPARDGPITRVRFCVAALSAIALVRSARSTSEGTIVVRLGKTKDIALP